MDIPSFFLSEGDKTFQYQDSLPSLPQPCLDKTLDKYLESVCAVTTDEEYRQTEFIVQSFRTGVGRQLQEKFLTNTANQRNWLEHLWERKAYLEGRYPSAPLVNIAGMGPYYHTVWPPKQGTQLKRGGLVLYSTTLFWSYLHQEKLRVDPNGKGGHSCMNQYTRLFNACKRPGIKQDSLNFFFKTVSEGGCPTHVVVICKGRFFKMTVVHPNGELLTPPELEVQLRHIKEKCDRDPAAPGIGALTGDERTRWAKNREYLLNLDPSHASHLMDIESSIITFVLDESEPKDEHELIHHGVTGVGANRWYDKGVNQIVFSNGTVTSNCDHAPFDGIVYIFATYFGDLLINRNGGQWKGSKAIRQLTPPKELVFHYDDKLVSAIRVAKTTFDALANDIETYCPIYKGYGKKFIRSFKLHPDAYVQMALQLAYYRMYKKPAPTYETGTVRQFYHGRTETVRSCTVEAVCWAEAMVDPHVQAETKLHLFGAALQKHIRNMGEAMQLKGCDRHLLALSVLAQEEGLPTPAIFTDPAFTKSGGGGNFVLSTSFVGYTPVIGGCAPMCDHGYGAFYSIQDTALTFFITSWVKDKDTDVKQLFSSIAMSLNDMRSLLEAGAPKVSRL